MARTKQCARKNKGGKGVAKSSDGEGISKVSQKSKHDKAVGRRYRAYIPREVGTQIALDVELSGQEQVNFFQHRGDIANEPAQCSLVHAFNNAVGSPLLGPVDMYNARIDLLKVASRNSVEGLYFGTDESGIGGWPIEVLMCALGYNFYRRCVSLKKVNHGGQGRANSNVIIAAIESHVLAGFDLIVELQFPANPSTTSNTSVNLSPTTNPTSSSTSGDSANATIAVDSSGNTRTVASSSGGGAEGDLQALPVNSLGERGHFIAVRNGLVYDSAAPAGQPPVEVARYTQWKHIHRAYRLNVAYSGEGAEEGAGSQATGSPEHAPKPQQTQAAQVAQAAEGQDHMGSSAGPGADGAVGAAGVEAAEGEAEGEGEGRNEGNYEYRHRDREADGDSAEEDDSAHSSGEGELEELEGRVEGEGEGMYW